MKCHYCKVEKEISEFKEYDIRKRDYICSPCRRIRAKKYYTAEASHASRVKNRNSPKLASRKFRMLHKEERLKENRRWKLLNREKVNAQRKAQYALKNGAINKQPCSICGEIDSEMHHADYSKPIAIEWLCASHHQFLHLAIKKACE